MSETAPPAEEPALIHGAPSSLSRGQLVVYPPRDDYLDVLTALRDDAKYAVDASRALVTLQTDERFVQVAQGGQAFTMVAGQSFAVGTVDVTAAEGTT